MASILFLIGTYPNFGGTEKVTTFLANEFVSNGYKVAIASFEQTIPSLKSELKSQINLISLSYPVLKKENKKVLGAAIRNFKVDIIINQWSLPFQTNILCRKARGSNKKCKIISVYHNAPNKNARVTDIDIALAKQESNLLKKQLLKLKRFGVESIIRLSMHYVYKNSDQYVILSESFKKIFSDYAMLKSTSKLTVITNPLTIDQVNWEKSNKEKLLIYVGRIDYNQKRVERIVDVWEKVSKELIDWKLEIVGDGPEREKLEALVLKRNIQRITFEGFQNPLDYYKRASLLLLTSEYEGFGLVIVEGMRYGVVPIVYGSYESVYDLIENEKTGCITSVPYNSGDIEKSIKKLATDENCLLEMSNNCIEESEKFTIGEISKKWNELFNKLVNK
ncbi:glycosyltransferase [Lutibacter sp. TH_r2]|uniref:glycosyltransferase n=1 Tax=Lutibacter sp. TH_r2 TaxID=3082083 RepID=UPI0029536854|nr:glycosyltransferase [Lutibacter sp. TH_r2]MDV7187793.1 glycosyltransferase [Lutibacter sp. TH_r2]